jgi:hypothetical protein
MSLIEFLAEKRVVWQETELATMINENAVKRSKRYHETHEKSQKSYPKRVLAEGNISEKLSTLFLGVRQVSNLEIGLKNPLEHVYRDQLNDAFVKFAKFIVDGGKTF